MAKKKKQPKQNIAKRQQNKANKRKLIKKKVAAQKAPQKQMSMSKVKKNLKLLPSLAFEPELAQLAFPPAALEAAPGIEPEKIDALADAAWLEQFNAALAKMDVRFAKEGKADKNMMTQAMIYFMSQEASPSCMNQLIVSVFMNSKALAAGAELDFTQLQLQLRAYDDEHEEYLEAKAKEQEEAQGTISQAQTQGPQMDLPPGALAAMAAEAGEEDDDGMEIQLGAEAFASLLDEIESWSETTGLESDQQERLVDDLTALFEDYASEKGWQELDEVSASKVNNFQGWFQRNMNPTEEDMTLLGQSLSRFFGSDLAKERFGTEVCTGVTKQLASA
ncbi:MAG: hypothetical protein RRB13_09595 [bacterium]|nr:hypothetical protein [bacterium]